MASTGTSSAPDESSSASRSSRLFSPVLSLLNLSPRKAAVLIFVLAFAFRLFVMFAAGTLHDAKQLEVISVAQSIVRGEGFANPFNAYPTGPTAHVAPFYPYVLAGIFTLFGPVYGELFKQLLACAISATIYALVPAVAVAAGFSRKLGNLAGIIGAVSLVSIEVEVVGEWEGHLAALIFIVALLLWLRQTKRATLTMKAAVAAGVVWGALFLTSPAFLTVLGSLSLLLVVRRYRERQVFLYLATLAVVSLLVVAPWIVRNYHTFHAIFWIRSNAGLEFYVSNAPGAKITLAENVRGGFVRIHPNLSKPTAEKLAGIGEVAFNREYMQNFEQTVRSNPARFARMSLARALWMWFPVTAHPIRDGVLLRDIASCTISLVALVGFILLPRKSTYGSIVLIVAFFSYQFLYCFLQVSTRYRFPLAWIYCLFCAYAFIKIAKHFQAERYLSATASSRS